MVVGRFVGNKNTKMNKLNPSSKILLLVFFFNASCNEMMKTSDSFRKAKSFEGTWKTENSLGGLKLQIYTDGTFIEYSKESVNDNSYDKEWVKVFEGNWIEAKQGNNESNNSTEQAFYFNAKN
jgi:hypothetical protein